MTTNSLVEYLQNKKQFNWIVKSSATHNAGDNLISFYNPARPAFIQIIGPQERDYLISLDKTAQEKQLQALSEKHVRFFIFAKDTPPLESFLQQKQTNVLSSTYSSEQLLQNIGNTFSSDYLPSAIIQGGVIIVENQGLLITGKSGAGKSQLLISMLNRGHLWVSEELTHCYIDYNGILNGKAVGELEAFAHVKHVGPINIDKTYGLSKRLVRSPLAGVIHLGENNVTGERRKPPTYEQRLTQDILGQQLPLWCIDPNSHNPELLIEACAKQLILSQWGDSADTELEQEQQALLHEPA